MALADQQRHAPGQAAHRLHFLGLAELGLHLPLVGHVVGKDDLSFPSVEGDGMGRDPDGDDRPEGCARLPERRLPVPDHPFEARLARGGIDRLPDDPEIDRGGREENEKTRVEGDLETPFGHPDKREENHHHGFDDRESDDQAEGRAGSASWGPLPRSYRSTRIVTGPSLTSATSMAAPKEPVATGRDVIDASAPTNSS